MVKNGAESERRRGYARAKVRSDCQLCPELQVIHWGFPFFYCKIADFCLSFTNQDCRHCALQRRKMRSWSPLTTSLARPLGHPMGDRN